MDSDRLAGQIDSDSLLWLLGSLAALYRIPFDAALIAQQFPPPYARKEVPLEDGITTFHEATLGGQHGVTAMSRVEEEGQEGSE